jgi:hypothetical protein
MPLLGTLLVGLFGGLANFFAEFVGKKVGVALAFTTALTGAFATLLLILGSVVAPLLGQLFSAYPYVGWMGLAFPPVTSACVAALGATWAGCTLYKWEREVLRMAASV